MFRKSLLIAALSSVGLAVAAPLAAQAAGTSNKPAATTATTSGAMTTSAHPGNGMATLSAGDRKFVEAAARGGEAEVQLGKLAAQRAESPAVKQFGQRMVDDHSKADEKLQQVASSKDITLPSDMDAATRLEYDKLQKLTGSQFDREYMKTMVSDHRKDVQAFQKERRSARDNDVKAFAAATLPTVEEHLKLAQSAQAAATKEGKSAPSASSTAAPERQASASQKKTSM